MIETLPFLNANWWTIFAAIFAAGVSGFTYLGLKHTKMDEFKHTWIKETRHCFLIFIEKVEILFPMQIEGADLRDEFYTFLKSHAISPPGTAKQTKAISKRRKNYLIQFQMLREKTRKEWPELKKAVFEIELRLTTKRVKQYQDEIDHLYKIISKITNEKPYFREELETDLNEVKEFSRILLNKSWEQIDIKFFKDSLPEFIIGAICGVIFISGFYAYVGLLIQ